MGLPLQILVVCSAPRERRDDLLDDALGVRGVVDVRETVTGRRNLYVEAVGTDIGDAVRDPPPAPPQPFNHFDGRRLEELEESDAED